MFLPLSNFSEFCYLDPKVGNCRGSINRWYYDKNKKVCKLFPFTECGGNKNNFMSQEDCITTCARKKTFLKYRKIYPFQKKDILTVDLKSQLF